METHRLFFNQPLNEYTSHPIFTQPIEHGLHETLHEMVRPPLPLSQHLGRLVLSNLIENNTPDMPMDRLTALEDVIAYLDRLGRTDSQAALEAEELARNLTFQHRFLA